MRSKRGWSALKTGFVAGMTRVFWTKTLMPRGTARRCSPCLRRARSSMIATRSRTRVSSRAYRAEYAQIGREACACVALRKVHAVVDLALMIQKRFNALKGPSRLDNGNILMKCAEALKDNPSIAQAYRDRFKLIMIDEFQDTDRAAGFHRRTYRPAVFRQRLHGRGHTSKAFTASEGRTSTCSSGIARRCVACRDRAHFVSLPDNFRSHGDILALVDAVLASQDRAFGSEFLHLDARGPVNGQKDPVFADLERVRLDIIHYKAATAAASGVTRAEAVEEAARFLPALRSLARSGSAAFGYGGVAGHYGKCQRVREGFARGWFGERHRRRVGVLDHRRGASCRRSFALCGR